MSNSAAAKTSQGTITGTREPSGVCRFSAIPYAAAPVGKLRWRAPEPSAWTGTLDATRPGPIAPQLPSRLREAMGDITAPQSEDCLNLTVWTPATDNRKRPVLVWLHGGAWQSGAGAIDWYSGAHLAQTGDIVVVSPNYRLGALGWLCVPGETANVGLLDQEAAIAWVMNNIEDFGGDPDNVTLIGQSAGAGSIACLLAREPVPRFKRAIMQSTPLGRGLRNTAQAALIAQAFLEAAGADSLEAARHLPADVFLSAQQAPAVLAALKAEGSSRSVFGPVADGDVLPADTSHDTEGMKAAAGKVDVIIGSTADEMRSFPGAPPGEAGRKLGDMLFGAPSLQWARNAAASGRSAWAYRFDYAPSAAWGACHCIEIPFVFGTLAAFGDAPMLQGMQASHAAQLSRDMQSNWLAFIRGGSPSWQAATPADDKLRILA